MKYQLPKSHGLSQFIIDNYLFTEQEKVQLTDAQFLSLENGIATGKSQLVISPTSTGKTQIAVWAIASVLQNQKKCVYLVTHRALARQKFEDFKELFIPKLFNNDKTAIVLATGDYVIDGLDEVPADPLSAPIVVATYEKYLAMMAASGVPNSMENTLFVCDEIQLLGDKNRGAHVEILITLIKNAKWYQFLGLSAVLDDKDADDLCNWLNILKIKSSIREKNLIYECWTDEGIFQKNTTLEGSEITRIDCPINTVDTLGVIDFLLRNNKASFPLIVFCMRKKDIYFLAEEYEKTFFPNSQRQLSLAFDDLPVTKANTDLARYLPNRFAIHCADLTDEERGVVENALLNRELDVVFSTTTLAAGVNFPLGMAVFHNWKRWDNGLKQNVPIDPAEFHNMAGRVGRMGTDHQEGRVIFSLEARHEINTVGRYLEFDKYTTIPINLTGEEFRQIVLQLISSGIGSTVNGAAMLLKSTFSGLKTEDSNLQEFNRWDGLVQDAVEWNKSFAFLIEDSNGNLIATPLGRAIAQSALLVETGKFLLQYFLSTKKGKGLVEYFLQSESADVLQTVDYVLLHLFLSCPEFHGHQNTPKSRFLPWQLENVLIEPPPPECIPYLVVDDWRRSPIEVVNSASLVKLWMTGKKINELELLAQDLAAGSIFELLRNLKWIAQGTAQILSTLTEKRNQPFLQSSVTDVNLEVLTALRTLIRHIYNLSNRISSGVPSDVLWMFELNKFDGGLISRDEVVALRNAGIIKIEDAMRGDQNVEEKRVFAFQKAKPAPKAKSVWFRDSSRELKVVQRKTTRDRHASRSKRCPEHTLVSNFYNYLGNDFETVFESILSYLRIPFERLDKKGVIGAPDYLIELELEEKIVFELKSKQNNNLVDYNGATEVLAASEIHGLGDKYCVTLCHPGVDPSVAPAIVRCKRLTVLESVDLGEALLRVCEGKLSKSQLFEWLTRPGQASKEDLPFGIKEMIF